MLARLPLVLLLAVPLPSADRQLRSARITVAEGPVTAQQAAAGQRIAAARNLAIAEGYTVETASGARAEIEIDEGSVIHLGADSLVEFSDLTRLSTGQRITLISLRRGTLDATAEPAGLDAFVLVAPGMELTFENAARVRLETGKTSAVEVVRGRVRFSSRTAELELREGQGARVDPQSDERFELIGGGRIRIQPITDQSYLGASLARPLSGDILVAVEGEPPQIEPLPPPQIPTYYYQAEPPAPPPALPPPETVYYPVYVPQPVPVPVPEVVVTEPKPSQPSPPPRAAPAAPSAAKATPPAPKSEPPATKDAGPEHRTRLRSPEGESPARRR